MSATPFTDLINQSHAQWVKNHPESANDPAPPLVQLIMDQESGAARDFAAGRLSAEDYQAFQDQSHAQIDALRDRLQEAGKDVQEEVGDWGRGVQEAFQALHDDHPDLVQHLESEHVTAQDGATIMDGLVDPLSETPHVLADAVDSLIDGVDDGMTGAAEGLVAARNALPSMDDDARAANLERLDAAVADWHGHMDEVHDAMGTLHDKADEWSGQLHDASDRMHAIADEHPDAVLIQGGIVDAPDAQHAAHEEAAAVDA